MADVLNGITHFSVTVEGGSQEFPHKFTFLDLCGERRVVEAGNWDQMLRQLGLHDSTLDQLIEAMETRESSALGDHPLLE